MPCLTVRPNTERPITITNGTNRLVEPEDVGGWVERILAASPAAAGDRPEAPPLWDGHAGERIADLVCAWLERRAGSPA